ncbi:hypothetical protein MY04_4668 [Flammeovirga sp. MY04]|uniref:hypothetical protein n=1 Tax=Flammeovirga sp. MY04 TaxID=1191459 RepID=UPI0008063C80|nr:hypothetical protein [Flammeovirga sp. MY04]ANQ52003.1 hypothetical protein MY04_4668 [Flammeovirga sp. MY04]
MKFKLLFTLLLILPSSIIFAQNDDILCVFEIDTLTNLQVYTEVEHPPISDIHISHRMKNVGKAIKYNVDFKKMGVEGPKYYFAFIVTKNGEVTGERMLEYNETIANLDEVFDEVTKGNWTAAQCNGKSVNSYHIIPIHIDMH